MNERIRELAKQATDWADNQNFYESHYQDYMMERFAKLIVRECAGIVENQGKFSRYDVLAKKVKEHFGVI
jgi:hypothetical protein